MSIAALKAKVQVSSRKLLRNRGRITPQQWWLSSVQHCRKLIFESRERDGLVKRAVEELIINLNDRDDVSRGNHAYDSCGDDEDDGMHSIDITHDDNELMESLGVDYL